MNKLYEIVRLVMTSMLSDREIGRSLNVSKNTVRRYRALAARQTRSWDDISQMPPAEIVALFNRCRNGLTKKRMPDFAYIHQELQIRGTTLMLLWEEYRLACPDDALSYSQFTFHYREFIRTVSLSMRQRHMPGERAFVDFSGKRPFYVNQETGERIVVELFVGVLGCSNLSYALAVPSQGLSDWIHANVAMPTTLAASQKSSCPTTFAPPSRNPGANR